MDATAVSAHHGDKLKEATQWRRWRSELEDIARSRNVWHLVNPDIDVRNIQKPMIEPIRPSAPRTVTEEGRSAWRDEFDYWKGEKSLFDDESKALAYVLQWILSTVDPTLKEALIPHRTIHAKARALQMRLSRSQAYEEDIRQRWRDTCSLPPKRGIDINKWLDNWLSLWEQASSLNFNVEEAPRDFLRATKEIMPIWWDHRYEEIIMQRSKAWETRELVESFRGYYAERNLATTTSTTSNVAFSTLHGFKEASTHQDVDQQPKKKLPPIHVRYCPCGNREHKPWLCYTLNEAIRPPGWVVRDATKQRIEAKLKADPKWKEWVDKRIKEHNSRKDESSSIDTKQPAITSANSANTTHDWALTTIRTANSTAMDDYLQNRWVLDSGSSLHVCNDRSRFTSFTPSSSTLRTGDASTRVEGTGTALLNTINPFTGVPQRITLSNTVFCPGFHTNLVSLGQLIRKRVEWDMKNDCIRVQDGTPIASLTFDTTTNLWLVDEPAKQLHAYAVQRSAIPLVSEATADIWHRRLAHVSPKVVQKAADMVDGIKIKESPPTESH